MNDFPEIPPVSFGPPESEGTELFLNALKAIGDLEKYLRKREVNSKVCLPIYKMRWGLSQLKEFYELGQEVCTKHTKYDEYLEGEAK